MERDPPRGVNAAFHNPFSLSPRQLFRRMIRLLGPTLVVICNKFQPASIDYLQVSTGCAENDERSPTRVGLQSESGHGKITGSRYGPFHFW
jgi:hypothetical protein